eukprot:COSAG03_NODE_4146_length_1664_cov_1.690735_1_plen_92_part_10
MRWYRQLPTKALASCTTIAALLLPFLEQHAVAVAVAVAVACPDHTQSQHAKELGHDMCVTMQLVRLGVDTPSAHQVDALRSQTLLCRVTHCV